MTDKEKQKLHNIIDEMRRKKTNAEFKLKLITVIATTELSGNTMLDIADLLGMLPPPPPKEAA